MKDAEISLNYFDPYHYDQRIRLSEEITIRFKDAGHILGSSIVELWVKEGMKPQRLSSLVIWDARKTNYSAT